MRDRLPDHDPYRAWANFVFIADDGSSVWAARAAAGAPSADAVDSLKFSRCVPRELAARTLKKRGSDTRSVETCLREPIRHVTLA